MTQTFPTTNLSKTTTPARPRTSEALPVLISIPNLATSGRSSRPVPGHRPRGRRRLRREIRVAGYLLLALLPALMAFVAFGGERLPTLAAGLTVGHRADSVAVISLEPLEPVVTVRLDKQDLPVILPGYLLPAETLEESSDGGH